MVRGSSPVAVLLVVGTLVVSPYRVPAQDSLVTPPAEAAPASIDLEASAGNYEDRFIQTPGPPFSMKGTMQFDAARTNPKWAPMAAIELMGPKNSYNFGLVAFVPEYPPNKIEFAVRDSRLPITPFLRAALSAATIPFELRLDRSGALYVFIADKPGRVVTTRPFQITRVRVLVSGAHVRFSNIAVVTTDK
jgi:hypothetical protein